MFQLLGQRIAVCALMGTLLIIPCEARPGEEEQRVDRIRKAIGGTLPYLKTESRKWMDGQVEIQDGQSCVSCHQVPSGVWSLTLAERALQQTPSDDTLFLMADAVQFVSTEDGGAAASWSQLLIAYSDLEPHLAGTSRK